MRLLRGRLSASTAAVARTAAPVVTGVALLISLPLYADDAAVVEQLTSPDGHKFWYYSMPDADRTALAVTWAQEVPVSSVHPLTARLGIDVMLNGGAGGRDAADIVADYQDLDAGSGLWVQPQEVSGFIFAPNEHLSTAREIAAAVITEPAMEQRWLDREKQNLIENAREDGAGSWGIGWNVVRELVLGDHPYKNFWSMKPLDEFEKVTLEDVTKWFETSFSKKTASVAVAGSATSDVVAKELDLLFKDLPDHGGSDPLEFSQPVVQGGTVVFHSPDAPKSVVILIGNLPPSDQEINQPLKLGVGVLGFGKNSRLFKTVRSGMGASYGFGAGMFDFTRNYRMLEMSGEIETAKLQEALTEIEDAYSKFHESGVGRIEFPIAKRIYKRELGKQLQDPVSMAFSVSAAMRSEFDKDYLQKALSDINDMKRSSVNEVIRDLMPAYDGLLKVIVTPDKDAVEGACVISNLDQVRECIK